MTSLKGNQTPNPFTAQRQVFLPSNLLNGRKTSTSYNNKSNTTKTNNHNHSYKNKKKAAILPKQAVYNNNQNPKNIINRDYAKNQLLNSTQYNQYSLNNHINNPTFIEQKSNQKKKQVLYKRLSNIRVDHDQLVGISFSKLLSRMIVMDQQQQQTPQYNFDSINCQKKQKNLPYVKCLKQKVFNLEYQKNNQKHNQVINTKQYSKSIDLTSTNYNNKQVQSGPSKKLFKKYYMPHSEVRNPSFFKNINPQDKYIYKNGKRIECKRIHNFYTSHMFKKGYDKFFRKTIDFSEGNNITTMNTSPKNNTAYTPYDSLKVTRGQSFSKTFYPNISRQSDFGQTKLGFRNGGIQNVKIKKWSGLTEDEKKHTPKQYKRGQKISQRYEFQNDNEQK